MFEHLSGPESPDKLRARQDRYDRLDGGDRMFKIVDVRAAPAPARSRMVRADAPAPVAADSAGGGGNLASRLNTRYSVRHAIAAAQRL